MTNEEYWTSHHDRGPKTTKVNLDEARMGPLKAEEVPEPPYETLTDLVCALAFANQRPGPSPEVYVYTSDGRYVVTGVAQSEDGAVYITFD